jgi:hypothetical protein
MRSSDEPSIAQFFKAFETGVKNQMINVHRFQKQGSKEGKVSNGNGADVSHVNKNRRSSSTSQQMQSISTNFLHTIYQLLHPVSP